MLALRGEWDVRAAGVAAGECPFGFAMADEVDDRRHHGIKWRRWSPRPHSTRYGGQRGCTGRDAATLAGQLWHSLHHHARFPKQAAGGHEQMKTTAPTVRMI